MSRANSTAAANDEDEEEDEEDEDREDAEDVGDHGGGALEVVDGGTDIIETLLLAIPDVTVSDRNCIVCAFEA